MKRRIGIFYLALILLVVLFIVWISEQDYPKQNNESRVSFTRPRKTNLFESSKHNAALPVERSMNKFKQREQTMRIRLDRIHNICDNSTDESYWKTISRKGFVWKYGDLHYCIVPKVGCTYWKRIIRFISGDYPNGSYIMKPSDIERHFAHFGSHPNIQRFNMNNRQQRANMNNNAFMFTRNPFSRLWSAFLDKFFLPEFWSGRGGDALSIIVKPNSTKKELKCVSGLSFKDFLTAITRIWPRPMDIHWEPIHLLCNPCSVQYTAIGKLESFAEDGDYILEKFGIHVNLTDSKRNRVLDEIKSLTTYNFKLDKRMPTDCFYKIEVARRLWNAFQYNGYIDRLTPFPTKEFEYADFELHPTQTFIEIATKTIDSQSTDIKSQRRSMMLEAYEEIPQELLDKIKTIYRYDFELFGYDTDLFKV